ncbi:Conserved hypothetical protein CHP01212 [Spirochaeta thermophila DSM 6578]|uniref:Radical SAM core domain-containing protein n=1 Tax=Winmispira thermophila (strain ATCC 700085 / DSM 6578 / Z-1203) TaxID=869211 RepID=G0GCQ2_WINT7|nr:TIGR01212 family radical SAM protein [Spirochaeta thermophila]AEJ60471.1 Conserved hypothetical protein CHP01212 [Spirochaeta thermophila DSM 6578]
MEDREGPRYRSFSRYLKERFGGVVYRVGVDAGFSCPHRDSREGRGCAFCDVEGSRAPYLGDVRGLEEQVRRAKGFLKARYGASRFLLYFQAYTNTYGPVEELRRVYEAGLAAGEGEWVGLIVSTRPDYLPDEVLDLLASYKARGLEVWVELGLQSAFDETLRRIRRGHTVAQWEDAVRRAGEAGLLRAAHLIAGLPGEGREAFWESARFVAESGVEGIKFHDLHLPVGAPLFQEYLRGELSLLSRERYLEYVMGALERIRPDMVVMRLVTDTPPERRGVPGQYMPKGRFLRRLEDEMRRRGTRQGRLWVEVGGRKTR